MRRVSSRQRLVSWDAFEANEIYVSDYDDDRSSHLGDSDDSSAGYETAHSSSSSELDSIVDHIDIDDSEESKFDTEVGITIAELLNHTFDSEMTDRDTTAATTSHVDIAAVPSRKRDRSVLTSRRARKVKGLNCCDNVKRSHPSKTRQEPTSAVCSITKHDHTPNSTHSTSISKSTSTTSISSFATAVPALIPGYSWEMSLSTTMSTTQPAFDTLMADVHLLVFAFCDLTSLRTIMSLNRHYRDLVRSRDSQFALWLNHYRNKWNNTLKNESSDLPSLIDQFHLPTAATGSTVPEVGTERNVNVPLLLSLTPDHLPTGVDESLLNVQQSRRNWRLEQRAPRRRNGRLDSSPARDFVHYSDKTTGLHVVRFTGPIGAGDRCIRSDFPLPRPKFIGKDTKQSGMSFRFGGHFIDQKGSGAGNIIRFLRRGANRMVGGGHGSHPCIPSKISDSADLQWRPFVCPFVESSTTTNARTVNVTPRLVSYYEVSILEKPQDGEEEEEDDDDRNNDVIGQPRQPTDVPLPRHANDCVAVGLATESFHVHSRMPGWDRRSYGYHGDDSGLFHASGTMVRNYGERFGAGDTVGCGVDYASKSLFFTLNGKFLGNGFTEIEEEFLKNDLYPVVGVDTNCPIHLNLGGETPFAFDLASFIMKDEKTIASSYCWTEKAEKSTTRRASISSSISSSTRSLGAASSSSGRRSAQSSPRRRLSLGRMA